MIVGLIRHITTARRAAKTTADQVAHRVDASRDLGVVAEAVDRLAERPGSPCGRAAQDAGERFRCRRPGSFAASGSTEPRAPGRRRPPRAGVCRSAAMSNAPSRSVSGGRQRTVSACPGRPFFHGHRGRPGIERAGGEQCRRPLSPRTSPVTSSSVVSSTAMVSTLVAAAGIASPQPGGQLADHDLQQVGPAGQVAGSGAYPLAPTTIGGHGPEAPRQHGQEGGTGGRGQLEVGPRRPGGRCALGAAPTTAGAGVGQDAVGGTVVPLPSGRPSRPSTSSMPSSSRATQTPTTSTMESKPSPPRGTRRRTGSTPCNRPSTRGEPPRRSPAPRATRPTGGEAGAGPTRAMTSAAGPDGGAVASATTRRWVPAQAAAQHRRVGTPAPSPRAAAARHALRTAPRSAPASKQGGQGHVAGDAGESDQEPAQPRVMARSRLGAEHGGARRRDRVAPPDASKPAGSAAATPHGRILTRIRCRCPRP